MQSGYKTLPNPVGFLNCQRESSGRNTLGVQLMAKAKQKAKAPAKASKGKKGMISALAEWAKKIGK